MKYKVFHFDAASKKAPEDYVIAQENIFVVTDGFSALFDNETGLKGYGKQAAEIAGKSLFDYIQEHIEKEIDGNNLLIGAYKYANAQIKKYNEELGANYSNLDFEKIGLVGCTCAYGFVKEKVLYFAQLNDSGVMVFDQYGNREIDFIYNQSAYYKYIKELREQKGIEEDSVKEHQLIRKEIINNFDLIYLDLNAGLGAMTGQEESVKFLHYGCSHLFCGQKALFYTDGFIPYVYSKEFIDVLLEKNDKEVKRFVESKMQESSEKYGKEKTLILIES